MLLPRDLWDELQNVAELRDNYSGRGMFGKTCIGIVGNAGDLMQFTAACIDAGVDVDELADTVASDNMGLSTIFYFPGCGVEAEGTEEE